MHDVLAIHLGRDLGSHLQFTRNYGSVYDNSKFKIRQREQNFEFSLRPYGTFFFWQSDKMTLCIHNLRILLCSKSY